MGSPLNVRGSIHYLMPKTTETVKDTINMLDSNDTKLGVLGYPKSIFTTLFTTLILLNTKYLQLNMLLLSGLAIIILVVVFKDDPNLKFAYNCFVKPFMQKSPLDHQARMEEFYKEQAGVYDVTRRWLLRGRGKMLRLCAAELESRMNTTTKYCWIDVGGGTGENIERMNDYFDIKRFHRVYLVDITPSLCEIARKRFQRLGLENVQVICMDINKFAKPEEEVGLITVSYSLTMIENYYPVIDHLQDMLCEDGLIGVVDFYTPNKRSDYYRQLGWLSRWFWRIWFEFDNVYLSPGRREYLEHKFGRLKQVSRKNWVICVQIPYYVFLGTKCRHIAHEHQNRLKFDQKMVGKFPSYLYAFSWEDPRVDLKILKLNKTDKMLVLTSGGCNVLEYLIKASPQLIHCVDLNACQNHLLELKLACLRTMEYDLFWKLFGDGFVDGFDRILDSQLSPLLSDGAYEFWTHMAKFKNLYETGASGKALKIFSFLIQMKALGSTVKRLCESDSLETQRDIWNNELRPHFLSKSLVFILNHKSFLWGCLGVPENQMKMLLNDGNDF